ncbi:hypothetical protein F5Y15DRAFT_254226 [Xylariaceae sp. FL0016]|nr:hypothetical protein F5Y15DRAFT_254226 [Xylariaceae sp. FL0016]
MSVPSEESQAPKFARYRSLRGKSVSTLPSTVTRVSGNNGYEAGSSGHDDRDRALRNVGGQQQDQKQNQAQPNSVSGNSIPRSMSRYRRRANSVAVNSGATQKISLDPPPQYDAGHIPPPPVPAIPRVLETTSDTTQATMVRSRRGTGKEHGLDASNPGFPPTPPPAATASGLKAHSPPRPHTLRRAEPRYSGRQQLRQKMMDHQSQPSTASDESQPPRMAEYDDRGRRVDDVGGLTTSETHRMIAEQKKKDLRRLEVELANTHKATFEPKKPKSPIVEKFVSLTKGRKNRDESSPTSPSTSVENARSPLSPMAEPQKQFIEPGGKGIVPQTDAPISAVNGSDRNVTVRCRHHTFALEVTPETTPIDILFQTSNKMSYDLEISPSNCVVIEQYTLLGLERRLRDYERIRDVMNSWDRDAQNHLVVAVSESSEQDRELDINAVSKGTEAPGGFQLYMYHSNRPGKWNKRYITLLENGQLLCSKKPNAGTTDKDTSSLCRLSDYDIYMPTESQMRRHIKPPKRHCFVVKSQQRTTVFMNTENYVQYFSTDDPKIAAQFREQVHSWRSWYLVDRRPEAKKQTQKISITKTDEKPPQISPVKHAPKKSINVAALGDNRMRVSIDESPYSIGEFQPLLDLKRFDKRLSQFGKDFLPPPAPDVNTMPKLDTAQAGHASRDGKLINMIKSASDGAFTGGLLGEGYAERKAAQFSAERNKSGTEAAFIDGPSLLNQPAEPEPPKPESPSWFPSALEHTAKQRSAPLPSRPNTSAGEVNTRRPSISSRPPPPPLSGQPLIRPTTQHSHSHSSNPSPNPKHRSPHPTHPNPLSSQPTGLSSSQNPNRRGPPKPLISVNNSPTINEPPQWDEHNKNIGHGVKAPEGIGHLIDLISVGDGPLTPKSNGMLMVPPRSALRGRPSTSAGSVPKTAPLPGKASQKMQQNSGKLVRTRSKSSGAPPTRPLIDSVPPVPSILTPGGGRVGSFGTAVGQRGALHGEKMGSREEMTRGRAERDRLDRERERVRAQSKAREREYRDREAAYTATPGRTGTLKVV